MSVFGDIMNAIFGSKAKAAEPASPTTASPLDGLAVSLTVSRGGKASRRRRHSRRGGEGQEAEAQLAEIDRRSDEGARSRQ